MTDNAELIPPNFLDHFHGYFLRQLPEQRNSKLGHFFKISVNSEKLILLQAKEQLGHFNGQKEILCQTCRRKPVSQ